MTRTEKILGALFGLIFAPLALMGFGTAVTIRDDVRSLRQYHDETWPAQRQILMLELAQLEAQLDVQSQAIEELEQDLDEL